MAQRTATNPDAPTRAEIEAGVVRVKEDLARLGGMMQAYGRARIDGAQARAETLPHEVLAELRQQLVILEDGLSDKVRRNPLQSLGLAALAGLIAGLALRR
ncbi:MAG TPA: hypothetical protein GX700_09190 [Paracoccus sp.]|nr:hypothetical protein [Paracoccus sp. (in: a-proteobacteria)]